MDSKSIIRILLKHKVAVIILLSAAIVCAVIFSSKIFISPLYKSIVTIYPSTTYSVSKAIMNTNGLIYVDPLEIGEEAQTDQMMQILNSGLIRDKIIEKYDLMEHYGIKQESEYKLTKLLKTYEERIKIRRTEYNSVNIIVLDTDPEISANIANDLAEMFDETMNEMQKEIAQKAFEILNIEYNSAKDKLKELEDSLVNGPEGKTDLKFEISEQKEYLKELKIRYEDARINASYTIPHKFVLTKAHVSDKPVYPVRWVVVLGTFFATLIIIILVLSIAEFLGNIKYKQNE
ncbi:MAG: Wzz/FepE/Etk N-terminal domain-containing protein [Candidatus Limimorpha sp.]